MRITLILFLAIALHSCTDKCNKTFSIALLTAVQDDVFDISVDDTLVATRSFDDDWYFQTNDSLMLLDQYCIRNRIIKVGIRQRNVSKDTSFTVDTDSIRGVSFKSARTGLHPTFNINAYQKSMYDSMYSED